MNELEQVIDAELGEEVDPRVAAMASAIVARYPGAARAVLFYGSCLRERQLDGLMLDFYLIVTDYQAAYGRSWLVAANRIIPPNVFPIADDGLSAKYAVLSEADFARECSPDARSVSVFARFAQPARLVWSADASARRSAVAAVSNAVRTLLALTRPTLDHSGPSDSLAVWRKAFSYTYGAELRAERASRSGSIVESDPERYRRLADLATSPGIKVAGRSPAQADALWRKRQRQGKMLSVLRLTKASFTFAGGIDYLAWKINRHAGTDIVVAPWQRRWPLLGALTLLPRLLARGAIR